MKESVYKWVVIVMTLMMGVIILISDVNYRDLLKENETYREKLEDGQETINVLKEQREVDVDSILKLKMEYENLKNDYDILVAEFERLDIIETPTYEFTEGDIYLLAQCVEAEAGYYKNHANSQKYVTQVILNRVKSSKFPNSVKEVIYQKRGNIPQFCVAYNGMLNRKVETETLMNVYSVIVNGSDLPENVLYFYSASVKENWVNTLHTHKVVEGTVFAYQ